jgi:hypothetical protein
MMNLHTPGAAVGFGLILMLQSVSQSRQTAIEAEGTPL